MKSPIPIFWFGAGLTAIALLYGTAQSLNVEDGDRPYGENRLTNAKRQTPPESFTTREALEDWAETSTFGGGHIEELRGREDQKIIVAFRCYTSGVESSDLSVFLHQEDRGWQLVLHRRPVHREFIAVERKDDRFIFRTKKGGKVLLELPFDGLVPVVILAGLQEIDGLTVFRSLPE